MKPRNVAALLIALLLAACLTPRPDVASQPTTAVPTQASPTEAPPSLAGFSLEYIREYAWKNEKVLITISPAGHYDYQKLAYETGDLVESASGQLTTSELEDLARVVGRGSRFFDLPKDLTIQNCMDGADEFIQVEAGGRSHRAGGYCVDDRAFRVVIDRLDAYRKRFQDQE